MKKWIRCWIQQFNFIFVGICLYKFRNFWRYWFFKISAFVFTVGFGLICSVEPSYIEIPDVRIKHAFPYVLLKYFSIDSNFMVKRRRVCGIVIREGLQLIFARNRFLLRKGFHYFILYFSSYQLTLLFIWKFVKLFCFENWFLKQIYKIIYW